MSHPSFDNDTDPAADNLQAITSGAQDKAQEVLKAGQAYARENPVLLALGALIFGILIGALCGGREARRKDTAEAARDLMDDVISRISDRLPNFKKQACGPSSLLEQCQHVGKKLKWW